MKQSYFDYCHNKFMWNSTTLYLELYLATQVLSRTNHWMYCGCYDPVDVLCLFHQLILKWSSTTNKHLKIKLNIKTIIWKKYVLLAYLKPRMNKLPEKNRFYCEKTGICLNVSLNLIISGGNIYPNFMYNNVA